jgi:hypothetical protein
MQLPIVLRKFQEKTGSRERTTKLHTSADTAHGVKTAFGEGLPELSGLNWEIRESLNKSRSDIFPIKSSHFSLAYPRKCGLFRLESSKTNF